MAEKDKEFVNPRSVLFRTVSERPEAIDAVVRGAAPDWLTGVFLVVGPGKFEQGDEKYNHFFDGMSLLHRFEICDGCVKYHSKFLRSRAYIEGKESGRIVYDEFGTLAPPDQSKNIFTRYLNYLMPTTVTDNCSINILKLGNEIYCSSETGILYRINPTSLDTLERVVLHKKIKVMTCTAHPVYDTDGTAYFIGTYFPPPAAYTIFKVPPAVKSSNEGATAFDKATALASIPVEHTLKPKYFHTFAMTDNYFVFLEPPVVIDVMKLARRKFTGTSLCDSFTWMKNENCVLYLVRRSDSTLIKTRYVFEAMFILHQINAYETGNEIIVDLCAYKNMDIVSEFRLERLKDVAVDFTQIPEPRRIVVPLDVPAEVTPNSAVEMRGVAENATVLPDGCVKCPVFKLTTDIGLELPSINPKFRRQPYKWFYASTGHEIKNGRHLNSLLKINVETGATAQWQGNQNQYPMEPSFIPKPGSVEEDDGIIATVVLDVGNQGSDFLLFVDGKTMTELGRAEVGPIKTHALHTMFISN